MRDRAVRFLGGLTLALGWARTVQASDYGRVWDEMSIVLIPFILLCTIGAAASRRAAIVMVVLLILPAGWVVGVLLINLPYLSTTSLLLLLSLAGYFGVTTWRIFAKQRPGWP